MDWAKARKQELTSGLSFGWQGPKHSRYHHLPPRVRISSSWDLNPGTPAWDVSGIFTCASASITERLFFFFSILCSDVLSHIQTQVVSICIWICLAALGIYVTNQICPSISLRLWNLAVYIIPMIFFLKSRSSDGLLSALEWNKVWKFFSVNLEYSLVWDVVATWPQEHKPGSNDTV